MYELMNGQELHSGDAKRGEVLEHSGMREPRVRTANGFRNLRMPFRESLHMHFVHDGLMELSAQRPVALPVEHVMHHDGLRHERSAVGVVPILIVRTEWIRKDRGVPLDVPDDSPRIRVDQKLRGIAAMTVGRVPWAVDPKPVPLTSRNPTKVTMPAVRCPLGEIEACLPPVGVKETQLNALCDLGENGEVRAATIAGSPQRKRFSGQHRRRDP
jgi:hypothetical protein